MKFIKNISKNVVVLLSIFIIGLLTLSRILISVRYSIYESNLVYALFYQFFNIYTIIGVILAIFLLRKIRLKINYSQIIVFIIPIIFGLLSVSLFSYKMSFDSYYCYDLARFLNDGNSITDALEYNNHYLRLFPYQYGYICLIRLFLYLFKDNAEICLKVFQILMSGIANVFLYKITLILNSEENENRITLCFIMLSLLWFVPYLVSPYIYGFSLGVDIAIISLYFFILYVKEKKTISFVLFNLLAFFASLVKMNYAVLIIGYALYLLFLQDEGIFTRLINTFMVLIILFISLNSHNVLFRIIDNTSVESIMPSKGRLVMTNPGLNNEEFNFKSENNPGFYNGYIYHIPEQVNFDIEKIEPIIDDDFNNSCNYILENPIDSLRYYFYKITAMWDSYDYLANTYMTGEYAQERYSSLDVALDDMSSPLNIAEGQIINIATVLIFISTIYYISKNRTDNVYLIICIWFLGGFLYHLLFEAKPVYIYMYVTALIPLSTIGLTKLINTIDLSNIKLTRRNITIYVLIILLLCMFIIKYNRQEHYRLIYDDISEISHLGSIRNSKKMIKTIALDKDIVCNKIRILKEGNVDGIITVEIWDKSDLVASSSEKIIGSNKISIEFDDILLKKDNNYTFILYYQGLDEDNEILLYQDINNEFIIEIYDIVKYRLYYYQDICEDLVTKRYYNN